MDGAAGRGLQCNTRSPARFQPTAVTEGRSLGADAGRGWRVLVCSVYSSCFPYACMLYHCLLSMQSDTPCLQLRQVPRRVCHALLFVCSHDFTSTRSALLFRICPARALLCSLWSCAAYHRYLGVRIRYRAEPVLRPFTMLATNGQPKRTRRPFGTAIALPAALTVAAASSPVLKPPDVVRPGTLRSGGLLCADVDVS
jgi:hypothetical protein